VIADAQVIDTRVASENERRLQLLRTAGALTDRREEPDADATEIELSGLSQ
jgi:hypothetical protein